MNDVLLLCCCFEWDGKGKNVQSHLGLAYSTFYHLSLFLKRLLISEYGHNLVFFGSSQPEDGIIGTFSSMAMPEDFGTVNHLALKAL